MNQEGKAKISYYPNILKFYFDEVIGAFRNLFRRGY